MNLTRTIFLLIILAATAVLVHEVYQQEAVHEPTDAQQPTIQVEPVLTEELSAATTTIIVEEVLTENKEEQKPTPENEPVVPVVEQKPIAEPVVEEKPDAPTPEPAYTTPPMSLDDVHTLTQPALVNILCSAAQNSPLTGATGSGIIIDPRGVILTNAHVAQYVLFSDHETANVSCVIRTGAPARERYTTEVLAFPNTWAQEYGAVINERVVTGTGEHDWALLYITGRTDGSPRPETFPFVAFDAREAITHVNDAVLLASYPAGFLGSATLRTNLWPVATVVTIGKVYTFTEYLVDVVSLGGNIVAQGGSSGGAVMNVWGQLVALIVTSSIGDTTDERDLRAVTLSHINTSVEQHTGSTLHALLAAGGFSERLEQFKQHSLPYILESFPL